MTPRASQLAPNVDAITREYVSAAIREAVADAASALNARIAQSEANRPEPQRIDVEKLANDVSHGLQAQVRGLLQALQALEKRLNDAQDAHARSINARIEAQNAEIAALALKLDGFQSKERYEVTRALVMKALRDSKKGGPP